LREPWDQHIKSVLTLKGFAFKTKPFRFQTNSGDVSQGCRWRSNPGLKLANACGVFFKLNHYLMLKSDAKNQLKELPSHIKQRGQWARPRKMVPNEYARIYRWKLTL